MNATNSNNADCADSAVAQEPRRAQERFQLNATFLIVPLDRSGKALRSEAFTAVGTDLSVNGLAVSHNMPMRYCRAMVTGTGHLLGRFAIEAEVAWTKAMSLRS